MGSALAGGSSPALAADGSEVSWLLIFSYSEPIWLISGWTIRLTESASCSSASGSFKVSAVGFGAADVVARKTVVAAGSRAS